MDEIKLSDFSESDMRVLVGAVTNAYEKTNKAKPKMQFSKKICIAGLVFVVLMLACNVMLALMDKQLLSDVTNTVVTVFGGFATGGYFALSGVRDCSRNKYHMEELECDRMNLSAK